MASVRDSRVILLAAQRKGVNDPLAVRFGTSHKCLIPLRDRPLIAHVLETLAHHDRVSEVVISVEPDLFADLATIAAQLRAPAVIRPVAAADNLADSVLTAAMGHDGPVLITTADNALLQHGSVDAVLAALTKGDVAVAMASEHAVRSAHEDGQRRFYQFRDQGYSNCNLYALRHRDALRAVEAFRSGGQFAKNASRIVDAFGLMNLLLLRLRLVSLQSAMGRISRRLGLLIIPTVLSDGSQAIDVDNDRTYRVVEELMARREHAAPKHSIAA